MINYRQIKGFEEWLMKDKDIRLDDKGFSLLEEYYKPMYTKSTSNDKLKREKSAEEGERTAKLLSENMEQTLLTIDGQKINIAMFIQLTKRRPLMFGSKDIEKDQFKAYLKAAIKDLLTDKFLTDRAYERGLDNDPEVIEEEQLWSDNLLAMGKRAMILKQLGYDGSFSKTVDSYYKIVNLLRPQLNIIAKNYDVKVYEEEYNKITISDIEWAAIQEGMPYPKVVPSFPVITNDERPTLFE